MTFGSCNNLAKINAEVVATWADILRRVPGARLLLKYRGLEDEGLRARYLDLFAAQGIAADRLDIEGWSPLGELLARHDGIDVALDPFPFAGGVTTCNALWMGVPVVTWPGETFASRHSLSYLSTIGLTETIAGSREEYVEIAVRLAADLPRLAAIRAGLRQQMAASPLCDGQRFAQQFMAIMHRFRRTAVLTKQKNHPMPSSISMGLRNIVLPTAILFLAANLFAADHLGYTDTPFLPGSKWRVHDRDRPQPPLVAPGREPGQPPADAIVLFDGRNLDQWTGSRLPNGMAEQKSKKAGGNRRWGDQHPKNGRTPHQAGLWRLPTARRVGHAREGRRRAHGLGQQRHPLLRQVRTANHRIARQPHLCRRNRRRRYGQTPPLVNVSRKPGEWQTYDIVFTAPRFEGKKLIRPACFTVFWNGVLVQYHKASLGPTRHRSVAACDSFESTGPLGLQYHNSAVRFRNIWIRPLKLEG